jgi:hypothetical protein
MLKVLATSCLLVSVIADLRLASQPKKPKRSYNAATAWNVQQQQSETFVTTTNGGKAWYMEPSAFGYKGLEKQRQNAYDNFLRSNIDNEQDKRNFVNEAGKDHLPFRSYEGAKTAAESGGTVQTKLPANAAMEVTPGTPFNIPLRWNNPHAAEFEVNIWIMNNQVVVPVMKPTCSGEGHKNNVFEFTIPTDWNKLSEKVQGFTGCNKVGDCVVQFYAHSVESRQYSQGTPIIVKATMAPASDAAKAVKDLPAPAKDPALDLSKLRTFCLPRNAPEADIKSAVPQKARLVSDVYNHAYQNSDYSPYSGQQADAISQNLQASVILKMVSGNRGELGKSLLTNAQKNTQKRIENQAKNVIKRLEGQTNKVINGLLKNQAKTQDTTSMTNGQKSANCFLCAQKGATNTRRLNTNTYVPSFQIPAALVDQARARVDSRYRNRLIDGDGQLQIYVTALKMMQPAFIKASTEANLGYLGPREKDTVQTLADTTQFKKRQANNRRDQGQYATQQAYAKAPAENIGNKANIPITATSIKWATEKPVINADTTQTTSNTAGKFTSKGANTVCRGDSPTDNKAEYYTKKAAAGLEDCQSQCLADAACKAVEYANNRCEIWTRVPGATNTLTGYICMVRADKQGRRANNTLNDGFDDLANSLANGGVLEASPENDSDDQLDPNGWCVDSDCDEVQDDEDPLKDKECSMPAKLFTEVDPETGNLKYEGYTEGDDSGVSAGSSLRGSWLLVGGIVTAMVQYFL